MADRAERIGLNEALFREVNERVKSINEGFGRPLPEADFVCECGNDRCTDRIRMTLAAYEELRGDSNHFAIRPGHDAPDVEDVVAEEDGYVIVAKHPGKPQAIAEETDPRS
jgi:hypothetical protein